MPDLRSVLQSVLALYGLAESPRHPRPPPTCIDRPDVKPVRGMSRP